MSRVLLHAQDIDKHFEITHAVNHVTLDFYEGEIRALIGENGSGKSTFTSMLTGIYTKDSGTFTLEGKKIEARNQIEANNNGVAIIVQETGTLSGLTVAENIFLGKEDLFPAFPEKEGLHVARKAAVISSVLFGLSHGAPLQAVYALIMGFALCVIFELRGGLAASALTHACVNLLVSVLMFTGLMESLATPACCAAFGVIALLLALAAIRRKAP